MTRAPRAALVTPPNAPQVSCSDTGSFYRIISDGKLYGVQRTRLNAERDAAKAALLPNQTTFITGILANQPTGTHFSIRVDQKQLFVRSGQGESVYDVTYTR